MRGEDIAEIFEPVVAQILKLIKGQIRIVKQNHSHAKIAGILLVGGMGRSPYLLERVRREFDPDCEIMQPTHGYILLIKKISSKMD